MLPNKEILKSQAIEIRPLQPEDIEEFDPILRQHVKDRTTGEILEDEIHAIKGYMAGGVDEYGRARKYIIARTLDGRLLGCMAYSVPDPDMVSHFSDVEPSQAVELLNAFVDNQVFRGGGVGRRLLEAVCQSAKAEGKQYLLINSGPRYRLSWPFYDKMADENRGLIVGKYGQGGDANTWLKRL